MSLRRRCTAPLLVAGVLGAGCGSDSGAANDYVGEVQRAQSAFVTQFDQVLGRLTPTSTVTQDRRTIREFAAVSERFDRTLARIEPPGAVREQHAALVASIRRFSAQFDRAEGRLERGTAADRAVVRTELSSSVARAQDQVSKAITAINTGLRD